MTKLCANFPGVGLAGFRPRAGRARASGYPVGAWALCPVFKHKGGMKMKMKRALEITVEVCGRTDDPAGKKLYAVVNVDREDSEETTVQLWAANDEDDLFDLVKADYCGEAANDIHREEVELKFDEDWGICILATELGTLK
jgi:hypothetical protein